MSTTMVAIENMFPKEESYRLLELFQKGITIIIKNKWLFFSFFNILYHLLVLKHFQHVDVKNQTKQKTATW